MGYLYVAPSVTGWIGDYFHERRFSHRWSAVLFDMYLWWGVRGSVLRTLLFLVFTNGLVAEVKVPCCLFAEDAKVVSNSRDILVQTDLDTVCPRTSRWGRLLNIGRCRHLEIQE